jgi:hypothetical protein
MNGEDFVIRWPTVLKMLVDGETIMSIYMFPLV